MTTILGGEGIPSITCFSTLRSSKLVLPQWLHWSAVTSTTLSGSGVSLVASLCPFGAPCLFCEFLDFDSLLYLSAEGGVCGFSYLASFAFSSSICFACSAIIFAFSSLSLFSSATVSSSSFYPEYQTLILDCQY